MSLVKVSYEVKIIIFKICIKISIIHNRLKADWMDYL